MLTLVLFSRPWDNLCESSSYPAKMAMFVKNHQIRERVLRGERLQFPTNIIGGNCNGMQDDFRNLIELCWHPNPDLRPDFGKIIGPLLHHKLPLILCFSRYSKWFSESIKET